MGLDCTAYSHLELVRDHAPKEEAWCEEDDHVQAFVYDSFPRSFRGLEGFEIEYVSSLRGGLCYAMTEATETHGFRAGSYSGYTRWREGLATMLGYTLESDYWGNPEDIDDLGFAELLNFADNEGCIGPKAAKDLLVDFQTHAERYKATHDEYDSEKYDDWTKACELASQDGLISFH